MIIRNGGESALFDGLKTGMVLNLRGRGAYFLQRVDNTFTGIVFAYDSTRRHPPPQSADVMNYIRSAAETEILRHDEEHRHRRFRRQTLDFAPDKSIEHKIADHKQMHGAKVF